MTICGTGGFIGPLPGDPDNNVTLSANAVFGGINVSWTYPQTNSYAVAHTILYRGINATFANAVQHSIVAGNHFYDKVEIDITYYYWITIVSVNGTVGDLIGPASATSRAISGDMLTYLTGLIDAGVLAQALQADIARIEINAQDIINEINNRIASSAAISAFLAQVQADGNTVATFVQDEITRSTTADSALVVAIDAIGVTVNGNTAAIANEQLVRANNDEVIASDLTILQGTVGDNTAAIAAELIVRANADTAIASSVTALGVTVGNNTSAILNEATARANGDTAEALQRLNLAAQVAVDISSAVQVEQTARINADGILAGSITTVQSQAANNLASAQTSLQTNINTVDGRVTSIGALYTVKVNVNGLAGGFGIYNNGTEVQAGFDVDTFWVGRTGPDKKKPFIISGGVVYMDQAFIQDLSVGTLKIANNAITIPVGATGSGTIPEVWITMSAAGKIFVTVTANVNGIASGDVSFFLKCVVDDIFEGPTIGTSIQNGFSGNVVATAMFDIFSPATVKVSGSFSFTGTARTIGVTSISVIGIMK